MVSTMIHTICLYQGKPILICGESDVEVQNKSHCILKIPEIVDCLQGILTVIPLQLLSFHIAVLKGFNVSIELKTGGRISLIKVVHVFGESVWLLSIILSLCHGNNVSNGK